MNRRDILKVFGGAIAAGDIPEVKSVERLAVDRGDIVVLKFDRRLRPVEFQHIYETWTSRPRLRDIEIIVLDEGVDISVVKNNS